jgi:L,D-transpeptidase ErfK/SrfK
MDRFNSIYCGRSWVAATAAGATLMYLSGCASLSDKAGFWWSSHTPTPSDRFELPPEGTDVVGQIQITTAREEDTLLDIARRYNLGYEEMVAANPGVDPWLPGEGTRVVLPTQFVLPDGAREGLVLNLASMRLFYYPEPAPGDVAEVITHPVGIGREGWATPQGTMHITQKKVKPAWTVPESVRKEHASQGDPLPKIVPPGPDNPLGEFAMRLSNPSYLIHGTNQPYGVGLRVSHGCVRLYPEDIARLFPIVSTGTQVRIINEPYLAGWRDGVLYLEAHPPLAEDAERWNGSLEPMEKAVAQKAAERPGDLSWDKAREVAREVRGMPLPIGPDSPDVAEVLGRAPRVPSVPPWAVPEQEIEPVQRATSGDELAQNQTSLPPLFIRIPSWCG